MKNVNTILFLSVFIFSCSADKSEKNNATSMQANSIVGKWTNVSLLVTMKRLEKEDSLLEAKEGEWEKVLKIKPIVTSFNEDSTFASEYYSIDGQLFNTFYGKWWIRNDSLIMLGEEGETSYYFEISNDRVRFQSKLDWDSDGTIDHYDAIQVKIE
ncbi:MAG: copper resistance protein NlpE [Reichenbachiella sp.]